MKLLVIFVTHSGIRKNVVIVARSSAVLLLCCLCYSFTVVHLLCDSLLCPNIENVGRTYYFWLVRQSARMSRFLCLL